MKNLQKRLLSVILTIALCAMSVCTSYAAVINNGKVTIVKDNFYNLKYARCSRSYDYGIGGKAADDQVVKVTADAKLSEANYYVYTTWSKENYTGYLVVEANIYLTSTSNHHFNEKAHKIFARRSAENINRILHLGLPPILEEENIKGMLQ